MLSELEVEVEHWGGTIKSLTDGKWLTLCELQVPKLGINGYTFSHEVRCHGEIVAVLPFRREGVLRREYLLRTEIVPPWSLKSQQCAITGGCDHEGEDPEQVALRELEEEAGYKADHLISLGTCNGTKSCDTTYHLYAVDVTDLVQGKAEGDGSVLEAHGGTVWTPCPETCNDPLVSVMFARLTNDASVCFP